MVKKLQKSTAAAQAAGAQIQSTVKDSAQQIWQAGLEALNRAQAEGAKALESLVKESTSIQRKTQAVAEEKLSEASTKVSHIATDISSKASGKWDKLENIFEERVAKALNSLGVPSAKDVNVLIARIDELNKVVQKLAAKSGLEVAPAPKAAAPKAAKKVAAKKATSKKAATPSAPVAASPEQAE
jgi:poly(hydroxyalkanoate) granule-associated protein